MSTLGTKLNLVDVASRMDPDGSIAPIAEILNETNEILDDMVWQEGNLTTGHRYSQRLGIPTPTWRKLNAGVVPGKSVTEQADVGCAMLEAYSEVDKRLADLNGNTAAFRASESVAQIEGMSQEFADTLFYGDTSSAPEEFKGFASYYTAASATVTNIGYNVIKAGGSSTDNTSMWLIGWSPRTVFGVYPKASTAGLKFEDKGQVTIGDASNGYYEGYRSHFQWDVGVALKDWRYAVRIANIDVSDLATFGGSADASPALIRYMIQAYHRIPHINGCKPVFYCNATVKQWLDIMAMEKSNVMLGISDFAGKPITSFWGIPVKKCDALKIDESAVS
jgi:hypothetical protein